MDKRTTDIVCYCTWVGLLIAVLAGNREASRFHLNQSLVLGIFGLLGGHPLRGLGVGRLCGGVVVHGPCRGHPGRGAAGAGAGWHPYPALMHRCMERAAARFS